MNRTLLVLYTAKNRTSMNALLGALAPTTWKKIAVVLQHREEEVLEYVQRTSGMCLVCFSSMTYDRKKRQNLVRHLLGYSNLLFCGGGPHITAQPEDFAFPRTILVRGEGEEAFRTVVDAFVEGTLTPQVIEASPVDFTRFPSFPYHMGILGPIEISRGCPFGCAYCQTPVLFGRVMRHRSIDSIVEHVQGMMRYRQRVDVRFITPNALAYGSPDGRKPHLEAVALLLETLRRVLGKRGRIFFGSFPSEIRPEFVSDEALAILKSTVDNRTLVIGAQSGSPGLLARMRRGHTPQDVLVACEKGLRWGFRVVVDIILGCPEETEEDVRATLHFVRELTNLGATIRAHTFLPLPGTPWGTQKPTPIPPWGRRFLSALAREGKLEGQWQTQTTLSEEG